MFWRNKKTKKKTRKRDASPIRKLFPDEARDFTPWVAENIELLSQALDLPLMVEDTEVNVGKFSADIVCRDTQGHRVVIENQLEKSDHSHLGQLMTYWSGLKANTAIWITPEPRPEHIDPLKRLNTTSPGNIAFYLVKVDVTKAAGSPPAPTFTVIVHPDESLAPQLDATNEYLEADEEPEDDIADLNLPTVWCVFPRRDKETYEMFLNKNAIGLGFSHLGDLRKLEPTYDAFKAAWTKGILWKLLYSNKRTVSAFASMYYRFVHKATIGDIVVYPPTWHERMIYVGKITSDYQYVEGQSEGYLDRRIVEWITSFPRDAFSKEALKGISVNLAFFQVRNELFLAELEEKLK
jgi:hypothetical protein